MTDTLPYPDYSNATPQSISELTTRAIATADAFVAAAIADGESGPRTFDGTLGALEAAATAIADAYGRGAFLGRVHPQAEVRSTATVEEERLTKWGTDLVFREDLAAAVEQYAATSEAAALPAERRRLLDHWVRDFRRAGHSLAPEARAELRELRSRLVELEVTFGRNLDEWEDGMDLTAADLEGLPVDYVAELRPGAEPDTYRVGLDYPEYMPFMQQARRRDLREAMLHKYWNRAADANRPLLEEATALRRRAAQLHGLPSWAHFAMEVKMASEPAAVDRLYRSVVPALERQGKLELERMQALLEEDVPGGKVESWDWRYYHHQQLREDFGVDANEVAQYLPLDAVVAGMFAIVGHVLGLEFHRIEDAPTWHDDVALYEIRDAGSPQARAYFYADLFPREGKYGHAAAFPLVYGLELPDGSYRRPVAAIVANFTKPTTAGPSLLRHNEVVTLFHEFGHILHFCLTTVPLLRFSGFDTEWDFVEAPSQIMEHWAWAPEVLATFARHHDTGAPIPEELIARLVGARYHNVALMTLRQVFLGTVDLMLHGSADEVDLDEAMRAAYALTLLPYPAGTMYLASFGHLMGGYDAGYYGYLWAQVYGDDMFSVFEREGILDPEVGARYRREVLERGGSRDAIEHVRAFLGREPNPKAFLATIGIPSVD